MKKILIVCPFIVVILLISALQSCKKDSITDPVNSNYSFQNDSLVAPLSTAIVIAENINKSQIFINTSSNPDLKSVKASKKRKIKNNLTITDEDKKNPYFYVLNYDSGGYAIISADKRMLPIIGYSENGEFKVDSLPFGLVRWLEATASYEDYLKLSNIIPTEYINSQWSNLQADHSILKNAPIDPPIDEDPETSNSITIGPLLSTRWYQACGYNTYCPLLTNGECGHAYTGCSVTAMAQVMAYWRYPSSYNWNSMGIHSSNETARLMGDIFPHVISSYDGNGSSCSNDYNIRNTLRNNFNYHANIAGWINGWVENGGYNYQTVVSNLNSRHPVILGAYDTNRNVLNIYSYPSGSGHTWVCDGYMQTTIGVNTYLLFSMNWG